MDARGALNFGLVVISSDLQLLYDLAAMGPMSLPGATLILDVPRKASTACAIKNVVSLQDYKGPIGRVHGLYCGSSSQLRLADAGVVFFWPGKVRHLLGYRGSHRWTYE